MDTATNTIQSCWNDAGVWGSQSCPELSAHVHCRNCTVYLRAAAQILDREISNDDFQQQEDVFNWDAGVDRGETTSLMVFRLGSEWLALPTMSCSEIAEPGPIHSLPHRNDQVVQGIVNIRGELLICVNLARVLGIEVPATTGHTRRFIVYGNGAQRIVFPVCEVSGVQRIGTAEMVATPSTIAKASHAFTKGIFASGERSTGILNEGSLIESINRRLS